MNIHHHTPRRLAALLLVVAVMLSLVPSAFAGQQNSYHDPAEHWKEANNRTNELDANAVVTVETFTCGECGKATAFEVLRTPEYTRDGQTAMSRNVRYSDGTLIGGEGTGAILDGVPGQDAYYTGYHWTKAVCQTCGGLNTNMGKTDYCYLRNVYWIYDCAANFFEELPVTQTIEQVDDTYHRIITAAASIVDSANYEPCYVLFRVFVLSLSAFIIPVGMLFLTGNPQNMAFAMTLLFVLIFAPGIATPVFKFNNFGSSFNNINEGVRRIDEVLSTSEVTEPQNSKKPAGYTIEFHDVSFSYEDGPKVLDHVSFTAEQGKITALVGPSGSGKSTIAQLIPRFWDVQEGSITIGGIDIRDMRTEDLMNTMSFVFQDCFLFSDTLYNNIAVGKPGATREEVYAAARAAQCHEFIEKLPQGYDTLTSSTSCSGTRSPPATLWPCGRCSAKRAASPAP